MSIINSIDSKINSHPAIDELKKFSNQLVETKLDHAKLICFFSTLWQFYRETPKGILSLSLRLSDEWMTFDEWEATANAAYVLNANCDEFGLHEANKGFQKTHHQLFKLSTEHFGITPSELLSDQHILSAGRNMGAVSCDFYRHQSVAAGLGFHLASEYSSYLEFSAFLKGFMAHAVAYQLTDENNPVVYFYNIHTLIEPLHQKQSEIIIEKYLALKPHSYDEVLSGLYAYLNSYVDLFSAFNSELFCGK